MAITYLSNQIGSNFGVPMQGYSNLTVGSEEFKITIPASVGFANGDIIYLCQIPLTATLLAFYISAPALDTGGSITYSIGDTTVSARYVSASTSGRAAEDLWHNGFNGFVAGSVPFTYTTQTAFAQIAAPVGLVLPSSSNVADYLVMKITAANTTPAVAGTLKGYMVYTLNPNAVI